jgi:hypothetical protein
VSHARSRIQILEVVDLNAQLVAMLRDLRDDFETNVAGSIYAHRYHIGPAEARRRKDERNQRRRRRALAKARARRLAMRWK